MAYKEVSRVDIAEVIRRWQKGISLRRIASGTGLSRDTVRKYVTAAGEEGVSQKGPAPTEEQLSRLAAVGRSGPRMAATPADDLLTPWGDQIYQWLTVDRLKLTRILELLLERGCEVSYTSLRRFIQRRNWRRRNAVTVRMEDTAPGEVVELDFGRLGLIHDPGTGRRRTVWALVLVLGYSRHCFVWPTFSQRLEDVIDGLESAWAFFDGIPKYMVIGNFPAALAGADALLPGSPAASSSIPSTAVSSETRPGLGTPRTSPRWSGGFNTSGSVSSKAATSGTWPISGARRPAGAATSPDTGYTAPPGVSHWPSFLTRSAILSPPGTVSPPRSPTGAP